MLRIIFFSLATLSTLGFVFLLAFHPIQDSDLFFYLTIGRWYLNYGTFPPVDAFIYTSTVPWHIWIEWGAIMFYTYIFKWFGYVGLITAKSILIVLIFSVPLWVTVRLRNFSVVPLILIVVAAIAASHRFTERASLFSELFTAFTLAVVLLEQHKPGRLKYILPVLFVVWANIHPGFITGLLFIYLLLGFQLLSKFQKFSAPNKNIKGLSIVAVLCTVGVLLTPVGTDAFILPLQLIFDPKLNFYGKYYSEYRPIFIAYEGQVELKFFITLISLVFLIFIIFYKKAKLRTPYFEFIIFLILVINTLNMARLISTTSYCLVVLGTYLFSQVRAFGHKTTSLVLLLLFFLITLEGSYYIYENGYRFAAAHRYPQKVFQFPIDTRHQPVRAVNYFTNVKLKGNIFNDHVFGAYLAWAWNGNPKLFYHGLLHDPNLYLNEYLGVTQSKEKFYEIVNKYNIQYFMLTNFLYLPKEQLGLTFHILLDDGNWNLTFKDEAAVVFERK